MDYFIEIYGEEDGRQYYETLNKKKAQTLENFTKKYGEKEGNRRYFSSMVNRSRGRSELARSLFGKVDANFEEDKTYYDDDDNNKEYMIYDTENSRCYFYDYINLDKKRGIEFNGDIFHGNPKIFSENDKPNFHHKEKTCKDMWEYDAEKISKIKKERGITILTIWESDYNLDPAGITNKCIDFIKNG